MSYLYDRLNRRRSESIPAELSEQEIPTVDDYTELLQAYRLLHTRYEQQSVELKTRLNEIAVKDEMLQRQGQELKTREAELLFVKAALQQPESRSIHASTTVTDQKGSSPTSNRDEQLWRQKYEQLQTELEHLRKRWEQRFVVETTDVRNKIMLDMLPFADHLDLALQYAQSVRSDHTAAFIGNIETVRRAFLETLKRYGIERVDALGEPFDPHRHEAVGKMPYQEIPADHVAQVVQAGYCEGEKTLRPARVVISAGK